MSKKLMLSVTTGPFFPTISVKRPSAATRFVMSRNVRAIESLSFLHDVKALVEGPERWAESELVDVYNDGLCQTLVRHAPLSTRRIRDGSWAFLLNDAVRAARRKRRETERR